MDFDTILLAVFLLALGLSIVFPIMNGVISSILGKYKLKWFKPKKFRGKKSPIYKLEKDEYHGIYRIEKWELDWVSAMGKDFPTICFPFAGFFKFYAYVRNEEKLGEFTEEQVKAKGVLNLTYQYRLLYEKKHSIQLRREQKEQEWENRLNEINKEFNENYIE